jgi:Methyltransferase domain
MPRMNRANDRPSKEKATPPVAPDAYAVAQGHSWRGRTSSRQVGRGYRIEKTEAGAELSEGRAHWDRTYAAKAEEQVSWFQARPALSLRLIGEAAAVKAAPAIDVGGGASRLADALLDEDYSDITVLDISEQALARAKSRLGSRAERIGWIVADVTDWRPERHWQVWHDRAVFHFLTTVDAQDSYLSALTQATVPGSSVIIATFALTGPEKCSGLPVRRYSAETLAERLGGGFALYDSAQERHPTPFGTSQDFTYAAFRRR